MEQVQVWIFPEFRRICCTRAVTSIMCQRYGRTAAGTHYIWIEELLSTTNSIAGAKNACKQAALNRTNSEMWHGENNILQCLLAALHSCDSAPVQQDFMGWIACKFLVCFVDISSVGSFQLLQTQMLALSDNLALECGRKTVRGSPLQPGTLSGKRTLFGGANFALISGSSRQPENLTLSKMVPVGGFPGLLSDPALGKGSSGPKRRSLFQARRPL